MPAQPVLLAYSGKFSKNRLINTKTFTVLRQIAIGGGLQPRTLIMLMLRHCSGEKWNHAFQMLGRVLSHQEHKETIRHVCFKTSHPVPLQLLGRIEAVRQQHFRTQLCSPVVLAAPGCEAGGASPNLGCWAMIRGSPARRASIACSSKQLRPAVPCGGG